MGSLIQFPAQPRRSESGSRDSSLETVVFWPPLGAVWLAGLARVALAVAHREVFGAEATLAFVYLVALPLSAAWHWVGKPTNRPKRRA